MERLRPLGFQRYLLEELSIDEQIALFHRAEAVVAPHGAGLSNLLFSKRTRVLELFPSTYVVPHYYLLAKSMRHRYAFLTGEEPHHDEDFTVNVGAVEQTVQHLLTVGDDGDTA